MIKGTLADSPRPFYVIASTKKGLLCYHQPDGWFFLFPDHRRITLSATRAFRWLKDNPTHLLKEAA